jgi:isocitrate/isopropylmalate dehydrogenase
MATPTPITVAHGDGIGPEIYGRDAPYLKEAGAALAIEEIEIGEKVCLRGNSAGIVMPNLSGDVLSDVAAQIAGSSNIGSQCAMFETIHGSAPRAPVRTWRILPAYCSEAC